MVSLSPLTSLVAALLLATPALGLAADYKITVEGCPSTLSLHAPDGFSPAVGSSQTARKQAVLQNLHANQARRARYSDLLLSDWSRESPFPHIVVGSLGTTLKVQGRVTEAQWRELRAAAIDSSKGQRDRWLSEGLGRLKSGMSSNVQSVEARLDGIISSSPNEFVTFGFTQVSTEGQTVRLYAAAKVSYARQCIVYVNSAIEAGDGAAERLLEIVEQIRVR